ncbi:MAG: hypothetical protein ACK571_19075 [Pseudanabaena sp.]
MINNSNSTFANVLLRKNLSFGATVEPKIAPTGARIIPRNINGKIAYPEPLPSHCIIPGIANIGIMQTISIQKKQPIKAYTKVSSSSGFVIRRANTISTLNKTDRNALHKVLVKRLGTM